jgi:uncharacterized protein
MKIAIVGSGIAGNVVAYRLCRDHDVTVFEAADHVGGHTHTHLIEQDGEEVAVDTGFIVYNDWTYPNFISLLDELGVESQDSEMSFSVQCPSSDLEYNGTTLNSLFAQRRNLVRPAFWRMISDIVRFNREAPALLHENAEESSLGDYLRAQSYGPEFVRHYILPMGSAIWSASAATMQQFPARFFVRFFHNHGMLSVHDRPHWRTIRGGSARYVEQLTASFRHSIRLNTAVQSVRRMATQVLIKPRWGETERFDRVFFACHSDQALRLLSDPLPAEREVLGAIPYQSNDVVLHTDTSVLPKRRLAWAAWNYHLPSHEHERATVTYNMNILQRLRTRTPLLVTLNMTGAIDPKKIVKRLNYEHPVFTPQGVAVQQRHAEIDGLNGAYFCGAYWRNGFHEDGVVSALRALEHFKEREHAKRHLYRSA